MRKILFVGGGTGGHILPMLAVMEAVQSVSEAECHYAGSVKDMDFPAVRDSSLRFERHVLRTGKLNRFVTWKHIPESYGFVAGFSDAKKLMRKLKPDVVFAKGGATSVPIAWAANRLGIPVYCHETDVAPGLSNRLAARFAQTVFTAFPTEYYQFSHKAAYVGQPVRAEFRTSDESSEGEPLVVVTGGSQGARGLNYLVKNAWETILPEARIVQVCGSHDLAALNQARLELVPSLQERLSLESYVGEEFPSLIKRATLVISRSGGTIFDLAAARKAAVLVPLPTAAQDHQCKNAAVLAKVEAAVVIEQSQADDFSAIVMKLLDDPAWRQSLAGNIGQFDRPEAAMDMANALL